MQEWLGESMDGRREDWTLLCVRLLSTLHQQETWSLIPNSSLSVLHIDFLFLKGSLITANWTLQPSSITVLVCYTISAGTDLIETASGHCFHVQCFMYNCDILCAWWANSVLHFTCVYLEMAYVTDKLRNLWFHHRYWVHVKQCKAYQPGVDQLCMVLLNRVFI